MSQFYSLKISKVVKETFNSSSIYFDVPDELSSNFKFQAGQYLTLKSEVNGEEVRRAYSISSAESDDQLRVSVKKVENGKMSTFLVDELQEGDAIEVMPPEGRFTLADADTYVFIAGGSGITPILSLIKKAKEKAADIHLLFANKSKEETMFRAELEQLADEQLKVTYFNSDQHNRLNEEKIKDYFKNGHLNESSVYICGPEGMIELAKSTVAAVKQTEQDIHVEYFASPENPKENKQADTTQNTVKGEIQLIIDGETHSVKTEDHETILEAGERIGIDPPFSCQSGVCTTCRAKVLSGEVEMENNFGLGQDEIDEGYILTCISKPKGEGLVVSWDED